MRHALAAVSALAATPMGSPSASSPPNPNGPRYHMPPQAPRTVTALATLRDQVIDPSLAGVRSLRPGRKPSTWTQIDRPYENLRIHMEALFDHLHLTAAA
jgi:hypothetical protein